MADTFYTRRKTQRQITNIIVEPTDIGAIARSQVRVTHRLDDRYWMLGGSYTHRLIRTSKKGEHHLSLDPVPFGEGIERSCKLQRRT